MKNSCLLILMLLHSAVWAQSSDSISMVKQIDSLTEASRALLDAFQLPDALQTIGEAKKLAEQHFGKSHPGYILGCNTEANVHWRMGDYSQALEVTKEALVLQQSAFGKENAEYAGLLHLRGTLHLEMGNYGPGEQDFLECLTLREIVLGKKTAPYAMTLNNLGNLYSSLGELDKGMAAHLEALQIRKEVLGTESFDYAMSLNNLGRISLQIGDFEKSILFLNEGREVVEKVKGRNHPLLAFGTQNLANAYLQIGKYGQAEQLYNESLNLFASSFGVNHPQYAFVLNDLGMMYQNLGLLGKAREYFQQSIEVKEKTIGREHSYTLATLGNLAVNFQEGGHLDEAIEMYLEIGAAYQKNFGPEYPEYLMTMNNLANLYIQKGDLVQADSLHRAVFAMRQVTLGDDHPDCGLSRIGMAKIHLEQGRFQAAWEEVGEAYQIFEKAYGKKSHFTIDCQQFLIEVSWEIEQPHDLLANVSLYDTLVRQHLLQLTKHLSAGEMQLQMLAHLPGLDLIQSARLNYGQQSLEHLSGAFDDALFFKGMLLENTMALENAMSIASDSLRRTYLDWKALQRRLAETYVQPLADQSGTAELERRSEELEKALVRNVAFRTSSETVTWKQVQSQLAPTEAAIEFVHFNYKNPDPTDSVLYAALVLRSGWEAPRWVTLFEEKQLRPLLETDKPRWEDYVSQLFENHDGTSLHELIWQPIEQHLGGVERIHFSPSGILHRIPLAAIEIGENETLGDRFALHQLGSTRQLAVSSQQSAVGSFQAATIFGGVKYDMDSTAIASANHLLALRSTGGDDVFSETTRTLTRGGKSWKYLPWTEVEAKTLDAIFKNEGISSQLHLGFEATEEIFRNIGVGGVSPMVLHIATHGYFFPDPASVGSQQSAGGSQDVAFRVSEHPMIRSGLILAGANHAWMGGTPLENMEDGILTAYEVSQMDLRETELVVLSACETGLGDIEGNEGVYGLQRAFKIAGARYLLMSLWQVPDFVTQELMTVFYTNWLTENMPIPDAFRKAQQQVKADRPEPFYWAGFVLVE